MALFKKGFYGRIYRRFLHKYYVNDLWFDLRLAAKRDSVNYILANMPNARVMDDRLALLRYALRQAPEEGLILEFGVEQGASIRCLGETTKRTVHGFDSFAGLPADWTGTKETKGKFDMGGKLPQVPANVKLHVGWFDKTLPAFLAANPGNVAFLHVDCDIYESTKIVFDLLGGRIASGTIIVFDEYYNYPGWRQHEFKAFQEFIAASGKRYDYFAISGEKGHVAVKIL